MVIWDKQLKQKQIVVPYEHLPLQVQKLVGNHSTPVIGEVFNHLMHPFNHSNSIRELRFARGANEIAGIINIKEHIAVAGASAGFRALMVYLVQQKHEDLINALKKYGTVHFLSKKSAKFFHPLSHLTCPQK